MTNIVGYQQLAAVPRGHGLLRRAAAILGVLIIAMIVASALVLAWAVRDAPFSSVSTVSSDPAVELVANDGSAITWSGARRSAAVGLRDLPQHVVHAFLAIEDRRFYSHPGVDFRGIIRAAYRNFRAGRVVEGGSTITQQYVRGRYLETTKTYNRKASEAVLALWLELRAGKDDILEAYLNSTYFGSGAYGIGAAADTYFAKPATDLTIEESALLAGLVRAPSDLNPLVNRSRAEERARTVLRAMVATGSLSEDSAMKSAARLAEIDVSNVRYGSWFGDWLRDEATALARRLEPTGAVKVRTTLDPELQAAAERVLARMIEENGPGSKASQGALVVLRPDGAILALVGGTDQSTNGFNRATSAMRQPGSLFKLFVYYAALRNGGRIDQAVEDTPVEIDGWKPANYDGRFLGRMSVAEAFWQSRNIPAVRLAMEAGLDEVARAARDLGIGSPLMETPSLALGTSEVTLLDMTGAYASVRNGKFPVEPWAVSAVETGVPGQALIPARETPVSGDLATLRPQLLALLTGAVERGTGRAAAMPGKVVAGKTGTSQDHRDAWFVGFTDELVVGVWVGNDDNSPMERVTGGQLPARIWKQFVTEADSIMGDSPDASLVAFESIENSMGGICNVDECGRKYRSFRASDCTFQPYVGERAACNIPPSREARFNSGEVAISSIGEARFEPGPGVARIQTVAPRINSYQLQPYQRNFGFVLPAARSPINRLRRNTPQNRVWEGGR